MAVSPREYFRSISGRPRKSFGQHFLDQPATARRIVEAAELCESDLVVEIGPGLGALTRFITQSVKRLHLVELDQELASKLEAELSFNGLDLTVHASDAVKFDFPALSRSLDQRLVLIGNLPYNISSPLIFRLLESAPCIDRAVFMVQKEVGERFAAGPGSKEYGVLSVLLGIYARVSLLFTVGPAQFFPSPKVDSIVLRIDFSDPPTTGARTFQTVRQVVNAAFQQRRKKLLNSLKTLFDSRDDLLNVIESAGVDPGLRPEDLPPDGFLRLALAMEAGQTRDHQ